MPHLQTGDSEQTFVSRFMSSDQARHDYPEAKQRAAAACALWNQESAGSVAVLDNASKDGWPTLVDMKVIVPGLVHYEDLVTGNGDRVGGNVLVQKNALDRMAASLDGKPIVNWDHRKVDPSEFARGRFQGIITGPAVFNAADGWFHAKGYVWDQATLRNIRDGYSISCAYTVAEWGEGPGTHNQVPYEREVLNGSYTHIAVVPVPRYEGARIELLNSTQGGGMGILSFFRKGKTEEKIDVEMDKAVVAVGGRDVALSELINSFRAQQKSQPVTLADDDLVDIGGGLKVTVAELRNAHVKNAADEDEKKRKEDEERKNADDEEKKKADEEKKNAADEKDKADKEKERENALKAAAAKAATELENARAKGHKVEFPKILTIQDRAAMGEARYGVMPAPSK